MFGRFADERSEAGETLIEVLLSSALIALVVLGIVGGIATMVIGSSVHRDQSESNALLVSAMENLKSATVARRCPTGTATQPAYTLPTNVAMTVEYQVSSTGTAVAWSTNPADCDDNSSTGTDQGTPDPTNALTLQRITLKYTHPAATNVDPELQFVKGDI